MKNGKKRYVKNNQQELVFFNDEHFQRDNESDYNYQYNEDLYTIYSNLDNTNQQQDAIERITKSYRPNVTSGFDISHFRFIRSLGQGMNGSVSCSSIDHLEIQL